MGYSMFLQVFILGWLGSSRLEAFMPVHRRAYHHVRPIRVGGLGWDNDNFLNSLSGNDKDREDANDRYFQMSRFGRPEDGKDDDDDEDLSNSIEGAELTSEMIDKIKNSHTPEEEASGGGKLFREMMNRAKERQSQPQQAYYAPPPPPQQQPAALDPNNLSVEEQARMFREMMQGAAPPQQPGGYAAYAPPPQQQANAPRGNYMQGGVDAMGRKIGRNRDADAIVNSADVYFAQLKRDSSSRNIARHSGDDETANAVFSDPSIQNIKLHVNPYLEEQKAKEKEMLDTSPDEMILPYMLDDNRETKPKSYSGISYKDRLMQRKKGGSPPAKAQTASLVLEKSPPPAPAPSPPAEPLVEQPKLESIVEPVTSTPPEKNAVDAEYEQVVQEPPAPKELPKTGEEPTSEESTRRDIRTLMGLMLKHRGGAGFGAGRLQGTEAAKMEALAGELSTMLREEAKQFPQESFTNAKDLAGQADTRLTSTPPSSAITAVATASSPVASISDATSSMGGAIEPAVSRPQTPIITLLACIEGATQMYRNSPPELQQGVLINLRAALLSAISACDVTINDNELKNLEAFRSATSDPRTRDNRPSQQSSPATGSSMMSVASYDLEEEQAPSSIPRSERINSLLACVEGAIQMYKNSPPELQEGVLITLRAALFSAAKTCNSIITEAGGDAAAFTPSAAITRSKSDRTSGATEVYDVVPEETVTNVAIKDENSDFFEEVLEKLVAASGNGKMGLREDISSSEAAELSTSIAKMRSLLVEELENSPTSPSAETTAPVSSKYEEMLAKARADKKSRL